MLARPHHAMNVELRLRGIALTPCCLHAPSIGTGRQPDEEKWTTERNLWVGPGFDKEPSLQSSVAAAALSKRQASARGLGWPRVFMIHFQS